MLLGEEADDCLRDRVVRTDELHLKTINPEVWQSLHRLVYGLVGLGNPFLIDHVRHEIKKPLVSLTRVEPESGLHVESVPLELIDQLGYVIDLVCYQRCLIHGSTPCAESVIAAMSCWA